MENCIKRAVIMAESPQIGVSDLGLPIDLREPEPMNLRQVREAAERKALTQALSRTDGNIAKAAEFLGISRPTLYDLMNRYNFREH